MKLLLRSILFFFIATFTTQAQTVYIFQGDVNSDYNNPNNFQPFGPPGPFDTLLVNTKVTIDLPDSPTALGSLEITAAPVTINATNSTFTANTSIIVDGGGTLNLNIASGGTVTSLNSADPIQSSFIGNEGTTGTLNLSGGGTLNFPSVAAGSAVGVGGTGVFNQSGSTTVDVTGLFAIGADGNVSNPPSVPSDSDTALGGTGTYNLGGTGSLIATGNNSFIVIGLGSGTGGGDGSGGSTPTVGILNINGGTTFDATAVDLGEGGSPTEAVSDVTGIINQNGGNVAIGTLAVGVSPGATGIYNLRSGTLSLGNTLGIGTNGGEGSFNYIGGTLNLTGGIAIGATGVFNQNTSLTLTNVNTQSVNIALGGAYNLNNGTLVTGGNAIFTGAGNFNFGGGTLAVTGADFTDPFNGNIGGSSTINTTGGNATLSGVLGGTGTLNIVGGGTVTLAGTSGAGSSWGAAIRGDSTLTATSVGSLSKTGAYVIGTGSTFNLNSAGPATFAGNISSASDRAGTATLNVDAGGNLLVLSGNTNLGVNSTTTLTAGDSLEVDRGTISNISGTGDTFIAGSGSSTGSVTLLGANALAQVNVSPGTTLFAANILGNVTNAGSLGTLGSINNPATLLMGGALISTNTLLINSNGNTADSFAAAIADLSHLVRVNGIGTNTYDIVTTAGGVIIGGDGRLNDPNGLTTNAPTALFSSTLSIVGNDLVLSTTQKSLSSFAQSGNEAAVGSSLDGVIARGAPFQTPFISLLTQFNGLTASQIPGALESLTPESLQYARNIAFENTTFLVQRMDAVSENIRAGYGGLDTSAINVISPGFDSSLGRSMQSLLAYDPPAFHQAAPNGVNYYPGGTNNGTEPSESASPAPIGDPSTQVISDSGNPYMATQNPSSMIAPRFSEFISGDAILADLNRDQSAANAPSSRASYKAGDATAGVAFRMTSNLAAGVLFDYNHTEAKTDADGSKIRVDSYSPGLFATFFEHGFYVNGLASFGYNNYSNQRNVGLLGSTASSSPNGEQYVGNIDAGYDFHPEKGWVAGPTLGLTYTHLDVDSFTETGAPIADLDVHSQSADSLRSRLGGHVVYQTNTGDVLLQPNIFAMWQHEFLDNSSGITSSFNDFSADSFTIQTAAPSRDSGLFGVGMSATLNTSLTLYINYIADAGASNYFAQSVVGGFKARF